MTDNYAKPTIKSPAAGSRLKASWAQDVSERLSEKSVSAQNPPGSVLGLISDGSYGPYSVFHVSANQETPDSIERGAVPVIRVTAKTGQHLPVYVTNGPTKVAPDVPFPIEFIGMSPVMCRVQATTSGDTLNPGTRFALWVPETATQQGIAVLRPAFHYDATLISLSRTFNHNGVTVAWVACRGGVAGPSLEFFQLAEDVGTKLEVDAFRLYNEAEAAEPIKIINWGGIIDNAPELYVCLCARVMRRTMNPTYDVNEMVPDPLNPLEMIPNPDYDPVQHKYVDDWVVAWGPKYGT
jgi:hypothetical protein